MKKIDAMRYLAGFFVGALSLGMVIPRALADGTDCNHQCSANSKNLQFILDGVSGNSSLMDEYGPPFDKLPKPEQEKVLEAMGVFISGVRVKRHLHYKGMVDQFTTLAEVFEEVFGPQELRNLFLVLSDTNTLNQKLIGKTLNTEQKKILFQALTSPLLLDPGLRPQFESFLGNYAETQVDGRSRIANQKVDEMTAQFMEEQQPSLEENFKENYLSEREEFVVINNRNPRNKSLRVWYKLELPRCGNNNQVITYHSTDRTGENPHLFCDPVYKAEYAPASHQQMPDPGAPIPAPQAVPVLTVKKFVDKCDLKQNFDANEAIVNQAARDAMSECVEKAKKNCPTFQSFTAISKSCADTRNPGKPWDNNADLSNARNNAIESAFKNIVKAKRITNAVVRAANDEERREYENFTEKNTPTGTCGPRPPLNYNVEAWMPQPRTYCDGAKLPNSWNKAHDFYTDDKYNRDTFPQIEACLKQRPPSEQYKCLP